MNAFYNDFVLYHLYLHCRHVGLEFYQRKEEHKRYAPLFIGHVPACASNLTCKVE